MIAEPHGRPRPLPAIRRLASLTPLSREAILALETAAVRPIKIAQRRELLTEGQPIPAPRLLLEGWAARVRLLPDGRRQFVSFVLPGDVVGLCHYSSPVAASTVIALVEIVCCPLPSPEIAPELARAYAISRALDEAYLMAEIVRLGRMNARERILDLMLELNERLALAGLADDDRFAFPLTQEMLADAIGLTGVHVNRMVQQLRRNDELQWSGHVVRIPDVAAVSRLIGRTPTRVA